MNCIICGRFMQKHGEMPDPENLEPTVYEMWYCKNCRQWHYEPIYTRTSSGLVWNKKR